MHHSFPIVFVTIQLRYWQVTCHFFYWLLKRQLLRSDHYFQKIPAMLKLLEKKKAEPWQKINIKLVLSTIQVLFLML